MNSEFWITTVAIFSGPLLAVGATIYLQRRAQKRDRRIAVFRDLMATRQMQSSIHHVAALNLIEIEFYGERSVTKSYKELMTLLGDGDRWDSASQDIEKAKKINQEVDDCRAKLLNQIARVLGYDMSDIEIMRGGYYPRILGDLDEQRLKANAYVADLADGKRAVPIALIDFRIQEQILTSAATSSNDESKSD